MIALESYTTAYFRACELPLDAYSKINDFSLLMRSDEDVWKSINGNIKTYQLFRDIIEDSFGYEFANLIGIFVQDARLDEWDRFKSLFRDILVEKSLIYDVKVISAKDLSQDETLEIEHKIMNKYKGKCEFRYEIDETLIEGMKLIINHQTIDVSIRGVLDKIKKEVLK